MRKGCWQTWWQTSLKGFANEMWNLSLLCLRDHLKLCKLILIWSVNQSINQPPPPHSLAHTQCQKSLPFSCAKILKFWLFVTQTFNDSGLISTALLSSSHWVRIGIIFWLELFFCTNFTALVKNIPLEFQPFRHLLKNQSLCQGKNKTKHSLM